MKKVFKKILSYFGYSIKRIDIKPNPQNELSVGAQDFFDMFFATVPKAGFLFVQIGANDGKTGDFLRSYVDEYNLSGVLIEPQPSVFQVLCESYGQRKNLCFKNIAIASETGELPLYTVRPDLVTDPKHTDVTAIATFDKDTFEQTVMKRIPQKIRYVSDNIDDYTKELTVATYTFSDFLNNCGIKKIDYLQIDCEGYDYEIIKMIDFDLILPRIINFESKWLSNDDRKDCETLLHEKGYRIFRHGNDTCAYRAPELHFNDVVEVVT